MKNINIIINAPIKCGKTTLALFISDVLTKQGLKVKEIKDSDLSSNSLLASKIRNDINNRLNSFIDIPITIETNLTRKEK